MTVDHLRDEEPWLPRMGLGLRAVVKSFPLTAIVAFIVTLLVYIISMPHDLTWSYFGGDGGELITASMTLGIPHPPGYPLYVLLGKAFSYLPTGTIANRYHLFSAVSMGVATAFISEVACFNYTKRKGVGFGAFLPGILAGFLFAFFPIVWSQGIIAEVYALNLAILSAMLWALLTGRKPLLVGLLFGVSLTTHITSLLLLPLNLTILGKRNWRVFFFGTALGLFPLWLMAVFAIGESPIIWGRPNNIGEWLWLLSAWLYRSNIFSLTPSSWINRLYSWLVPFIIPVLILLFLLLNDLRGMKWMIKQPHVRMMFLTAAGYTLYAAGYATPDAIVLLLPAVLLLAMLIAISIRSSRLNYLLLVPMIGLGILYLITGREAPLRNATLEVFSQIPDSSIVITPGDPTVAAVSYFTYAEEVRPDLIIVDHNLFQFEWYREHLWEFWPDLIKVGSDDIDAFIKGNSANFEVCRLSLYNDKNLQCGISRYS